MNNEFFLSYLNSYSPVGEEISGQKVWMNEVSKHVDEVTTDAYGNVYALIKSKNQNPKKVVLEAHADEIAWQVTYIGGDGIIRVNRNGGSDSLLAPSKRVVIFTRKNGLVPGVFGYPAIHTRKNNADKVSKPEDLLLDVGVDSKEAVLNLGIEVGNMVTFSDETIDFNDYFLGKSIDNKAGGFIIAEVAKKLKENNIELPFDLYVTNCITEEVGLYGARMAAKHVSPDCALVVDVCHHTATPTISKDIEGDVICGKGPSIEMKFQNHRKLTELYRKMAEENEIPYQLCVGSTGNDTMSFYVEGIPTAILGLPLKYMHSTNECVHKSDIESTIELFYHTLLNLDVDSLKYH